MAYKNTNSFKCNTYKKQGGGVSLLLSTSSALFSAYCFLSLLGWTWPVELSLQAAERSAASSHAGI